MRTTQIKLVLASIVVSVLVAELLVRFVAPISEVQLLPLPYNGDRVRLIIGGDTYLTYDPDLGWTLTPSRTRRADGAVYRINSQSIRADREYPQDAPSDVRRITAFGDSFTHCSESTQVDCWSVQLEQALPGTEVLNFGVPGYGPDQAWLRYQRDGQKFGGCAVLIGYFVDDIERVINRFRPFIHPDDSVVLSKPRFLLDGDALTLMPNPVTDLQQLFNPAWVEQTLGQHDAWYVPGTFVHGPLDASRLVRLARTAAFNRHRAALQHTEHGYALYDEDQEALQITQRILLQFSQEVSAGGASPVIVVFPGKIDLRASDTSAAPYAGLISNLRAAGATTLDLTPVLREGAARHGVTALFNDTHYSKLGNAIVAQELAGQLPELTRKTCEWRASQ